MILRCRLCGPRHDLDTGAVDVGEGNAQTWHPHLWDHLLDEHFDIVAVGRQHTVEFRGAKGLTAYVREAR